MEGIILNLTYQDALAYLGIGGAHPGGLTLTKQILSNEDIKQSTNILDAGCGTGQTSAFLSETYQCQITALDSHPVMLQKAKQRFTYKKHRVTFIRGSVESIPIKDNSFDYIISESVTAFTNVNKALSEYYRVLKKNGVLINIDMTAEYPLKTSEIQLFADVYGITKVLTEKEWLSKLHSGGFRNTEILHSDTLSAHLQKNIEQPDFHLSSPLDPKLHEILFKHQQITEQFSKKIGFRVFRSIR